MSVETLAACGDRLLWTTVLVVGFLCGCSEIYEARSLVHVRSGEWIAGNSYWPPATDPFSQTASDRRWVNLSWGFDLLSAGLVPSLGYDGLSVLLGLVAVFLVWMLLKCRLAHGSSWPATLAGTLAILAVSPQLTWSPELVTLLGMVCLLRLAVRSTDAPVVRASTLFVPLGMWAWSQFDPRAWLGIVFLASMTVGAAMDRRSPLAMPTREPPWGTWLGLSLAAMLLHPFGIQTWFSPWSLYVAEYPAWRQSYPLPIGDDVQYFPLWSPQVWHGLDHRLAAGLLLQLAAIGSLWLNRSRTTGSDWCLWGAFNGLALLTLREAPIAALVNAGLATRHAQSWYQANYSGTGERRWPEMSFMLGGRMVTWTGLVALAMLVLTGAFDHREARQFGTGLSCSLQIQLEDFRRLSETTPDDAGFHFTIRQGDALIAAGRRSFVDHRVRLFLPQSRHPENLLAVHDRTRRALRQISVADIALENDGQAPEPQGESAIDRFHVSHLLPRLTQHRKPPDYLTFLALLGSRDWALSEVWPTVAVFLRTEGPEPAVNDYGKSHRLNVLHDGFRSMPTADLPPRERTIPQVWSMAEWLEPDDCPSRGTQIAQHWLRLEQEFPTAPIPFQIGAGLSAVRSAQAGVVDAPHSAISYRTLGATYAHLLRMESLVLAERGVAWGRSLRYFQAVAPLQQAALLNPGDPSVHWLLFELFRGAGYADVTHQALTRCLTLVNSDIRLPPEMADFAAVQPLQRRLAELIAQTQDRRDAAMAQSEDRLQIAESCYRDGCLQLAIETLESSSDYLRARPLAQFRLAVWRAERGDGIELDRTIEQLKQLPTEGLPPRWRDVVAYAALGRGDYSAATLEWDQELRQLNNLRLSELLQTAPLLGLPMAPHSLKWYPLGRLDGLRDWQTRNTELVGLAHWQNFVAHLEAGHCDESRRELMHAISAAPHSHLRPLYRLYWYCLTDELLDPVATSDRIPDDAASFMPEP